MNQEFANNNVGAQDAAQPAVQAQPTAAEIMSKIKNGMGVQFHPAQSDSEVKEPQLAVVVGVSGNFATLQVFTAMTPGLVLRKNVQLQQFAGNGEQYFTSYAG